MKTVILTSGPRGSGKSEYAKYLMRCLPGAALVSRDEVLMTHFGKTSLSVYTGAHVWALDRVMGILQEYLSEDCPVEIVILDCWNGYASDRKKLIHRSRSLGADRVLCLFFVVSEDLCTEWFMNKPDVHGYSEHSARHDHQYFYHEARDIRNDGFDEVITVNSNQQKLNFTF